MGANAQTSVPAFTSGQVLTAAQVNQINTGIPVFASSTERDAAFGGTGEKTLAEGQMAYLEDTNETQYYDGSSWAAVGAAGGKILQVVFAEYATEMQTSSTSYVTSGLAATITPSDSGSRIWIVTSHTTLANTYGSLAIYRDFGGGSPTEMIESREQTVSGQRAAQAMSHVDSPASTSAQTYTLVAKWNSVGTYFTVQRDNTKSTMTLVEIAP